MAESSHKEVGSYFRAGKLKNKETVVAGIDQMVGAFIGLFQGHNVGKMVVKLNQALTFLFMSWAYAASLDPAQLAQLTEAQRKSEHQLWDE